MIKTILVAATGNEADNATYAAALCVARPFAAHLDALHARLDAVNTAAAMVTDAGSGALTAGLIDRLERDALAREERAHALFERFCASAGLAAGNPSAQKPSAEWHVETGDEPGWMATYGLAADLIVAPRASDGDPLARSTLEAVLVETGRPVLIPSVAPMPADFTRVAIAWKPTPQAARAVALAMPLLARAREVVVATVDEEPQPRDAADWLVRNLAWHGLTARTERLQPGSESAAETLLAHLRGRADLLVMGGYGHSRFREWVFGGFTRRVLADAPLPVLLAH